MILKEFGKAKNFANYTSEGVKPIDETEFILYNNFDGFYQNHHIGRIIYIFKTEKPYFLISEQKFFFEQIRSIDYRVDGDKREFIFTTNIVNHYYYNTFWISELDMIEFALGYPDDDENDLIKVIFNRINSFLLNKI
ncbi:MAG: hypothetical protein ABI315_13565 [Bacteroidia bacterium]